MVLKRILVTALSALGLGALAAGTAFGQGPEAPGDGNIPAPNLFDDQIACSMNVPTGKALSTPTVVPMGAMTSALDDAIGMGMSTITIDPDNSNADGFVDVGFVVPAMVANCGAGSSTDAFSATGDGAAGPVATDVAKGYSTVLERYVAVYGDPADVDEIGAAGKLAMARSARAMADDDASDATIEALDEAVEDAQEGYDEALAAFNAISQGPIYQAGVAEWMAKAAVTDAADKYNKAVEKAYGNNGTGGSYAILNALEYSEYVPLIGGELFTTSGGEDAAVTITNGMAMVNHGFLAEYANEAGTNQATVEDDGATTVELAGSNFDAAGRLVVPMVVDAGDADDDGASDDLIPVYATTGNSVAEIRTRRDNAKLAADALKKALDENTNPLRQAVLEEAYRRARIESDYYNRQMTNTLADTETQTSDLIDDDAETDEDESMTNIATRYAAYIKDSNARADAEADLRAKAATREAATAAVVSQFTSPASFYEQLVARRQVLKAEADKVVADATNPSESQTDAADDAAKALADARKAQSDYQALIGDDPDDPVAGLIDELLKTDGDDGKALVDAIGATYDTANAAKETADQVADDIKGLTGETGAVSENTEKIATNTKSIGDLEDEVFDADGNSRVDANETRSMANAAEIGMDDNGMSRIDHNENRSMANETRSMDNETRSMANETRSMDNETRSMDNETRSEANEMEIGMDDDGMSRIDHNETRSMANETRGMANAMEIGMDDDGMSRIDHNETRSMANETRSMANATRSMANETAIGMNEMAIGELSDDLDVVRAGVAASMALAGMPAINGRGISIGVGSFDGESAFAVGFQIQGEQASFKIGVTSSGGETGASAGVGFQF